MSPVEPTVPDRDIDLVLITGAGASRNFGVNGGTLPLMHDWSEDLVKRLTSLGPGFLEATGLERSMGGEAFEIQLGRFLRAAESFRGIGHLLHPIGMTEPGRSPLAAADAWAQWHAHAVFQLDQIVRVINESLYELFANQAIDSTLAIQAYGALFDLLGVGRRAGTGSPRWVYATTNYDTIGELAIDGTGKLPDAGDTSYDTRAERPIQVERLIDGMPRFVPVLHLHGRVGWLRRDDGSFSSPAIRYEPTAGAPIIMLPDLEKVYENVGIIEPIWEQFGEALRRAQRVFVLGHSLHDRALIRALKENLDDLSRVAVTFHASDADPSAPADRIASLTRNRIGDELPRAHAIPIRFKAGVNLQTLELQSWLDSSPDYRAVS